MDQKPPPYAPPYSVQSGDPSGQYPYPANAPYPANPTYPANNPYPSNPPYPVGQSGFPQPQPMMNQPQGYPMPPPQQTTVIVQGPAPGFCPSCRSGTVTREFTCCGICCAIFFFPIGILCCLCMRENRCTVCRARF